MQVGDTMTLAPMPRGSSGGVVTTGTTFWSIESGVNVATLHPLYMTLLLWPNTPTVTTFPLSSAGGTGRIGLKGRSPGQAELVVVWFSAGGARIQKNITVIVTPHGTPTIFTPDAYSVNDPAGEQVPVTVGKTRQYRLRSGNDTSTVSQTLVQWLSSQSTIADITPNGATGGFATCRSVGLVTILANVPTTGEIATANLACGIPTSPTVTVSITPTSSTVKVGSDVTFDATAVDPLVLTNIRWRVPGENAVVVSAVSSSPLTSRVIVRGMRAGQTRVVAEYGDGTVPGATDSASLTVTPRTLRLVPATTPTPVAAGATQQYTIEETDAANNRIGTIPATLFTWFTDATWAEVDANGKATCATTGPGGTITIFANQAATAERLTATLTCSAPVPPPSNITLAVNPRAVSVSAGRATTLSGVVTGGASVTDVTWTTRDGSVATISSNGGRSIIVNGVKPGSSTYVIGSFAYFGGVATDSALVTVTAASSAAVDHITLEPDSVDVAKGQLVQYRIRYWNASNVEMNAEVGATILFTEDVSSVAQIDASTGLLTTRGVGSTPVTASYRMPYYSSLLPAKASLIAKAKVVVH
jgi:hypothetical protein